jgi:septum site-determining protein MinC
MKITFQGSVVILGDVNPGAEIIASGSVIVWGRLRGTVHAGAEGDEKAVVAALDMRPMQLRIASLASITPERRGKVQPEMARIENGRVVADSWDSK